MKITSLDRVEKIPMPMEGAKDVWKQIPLAKADGVPAYSMRVFTIEADGHTPYHAHPFEHLNYIVDGEGAVVTSTGEERPVKKGDYVLVMPDEVHQYKNTSSDKPFVLICVVPKEYE